MALAFPGDHSHTAEHLAKDAFLTALDPDLAFNVRSQAPTSLDDAPRRVQQVEISRLVVDSAPDTRNKRYASRQMWDGAGSEGAVGETRYEPDDGYPGQTRTTAPTPSQPTTKVKEKMGDVRHSSPARSNTRRHIITDSASDNSHRRNRRRNRAVADVTAAQPDRDKDKRIKKLESENNELKRSLERQTSFSQQLQTLLSVPQQQSQALAGVPPLLHRV